MDSDGGEDDVDIRDRRGRGFEAPVGSAARGRGPPNDSYVEMREQVLLVTATRCRGVGSKRARCDRSPRIEKGAGSLGVEPNGTSSAPFHQCAVINGELTVAGLIDPDTQFGRRASRRLRP